MIEETVFSNEALKNIIKKYYDIDVFDIQKLNRGSANLFSLNNKQYILKEFQSKYTYKEIEKEIIIINHLKNENLPVPEYIKTVDNKYSFIYQNKICIMQKYINGYPMESNTGTYEQMIESATNLGKLVKSLETLKYELPINDISSWCSIELINEGIEKNKKLLTKINKKDYPQIYEDLENKIIMLQSIRIDYDELKYLTLKNTHGDYSVLQFIYQKNKIAATIDFVSACKMPIVWEIIRSYSYIDSNAKDGKIDIDNLTHYVKEFMKYGSLNQYDLKYMTYLYLVQLLTSTYGYKQYIEDNSKMELLEFAFFRTKLAKYLFDNTKNISDKLGKI